MRKSDHRGLWVVSDTFNGIRAGDWVKVDVTKVAPVFEWMRKYTFEFQTHGTNIETGKQWVTVWAGGTKFTREISISADAVELTRRGVSAKIVSRATRRPIKRKER